MITKSGWIYGQAALHHPEGYIRGYPMYYPHQGGERIFRGNPYTKYMRSAETAIRPLQPYPNDPVMDPWSALVPLEEVEETLNCIKSLRVWRKGNDPRKELIDKILREASIPLRKVGLGGSHALRCARSDSDVDIIVYGMGNASHCIREIEQTLLRRELSLMDSKTADSYARRYSILYSIPHEKLFRLFALDLTEVYVNGLKISFIFVYDDKERDLIPRQIYAAGEHPDTYITGRVVSETSSWVYPRQYLIQSDEGNLYSVWSHHWFYKGIATIGAHVEVVAADCGDGLLSISSLNHRILSLS